MIKISALELEQAKSLSNTRFPCVGHIDVKEVLEFRRQGRDVLRVTGIQDNEELVSWEVMDTCQGDIYMRTDKSSNKLSTFRWPFFAYTLGHSEVVIRPLEDSEYVIHYKLAFEK